VFPSAMTLRQRAPAIGRKRDPIAIRRPGGTKVAARTGGERFSFMRSYVKNPQICGASRACRHENDLAAIGRKCGLIVECGIIGQTLQTRSIRPNTIKVG